LRSLIVTIDGPAGTGKSTVSRRVAQRLEMPHLDTGAFYRAAALVAIRAAVDLDDESAVAGAVATAFFDQIDGRMLIDGEDVSLDIRDPFIAAASSTVAAHPGVRVALVNHQRCWVELHGCSAVVEGRDIGSVVFPDAAVKIFLEADARVRAERRAQETGQEVDVVLAEQLQRDHQDSSRPDSPLIIPEGATIVDTSSLDIDQVVDRVVALVEAASF
jgi:cytidylate kinase